MSFSDYLEGRLLDLVFGAVAWTPPANLYVGLFDADPGEDGGGATEVSGAAYARAALINDKTVWSTSAPSGQPVSNQTEIVFPEATGDWAGGAPITHFALFDAAAGGNLMASGALTAAVTVTGGDRPRFGGGDMTITLD